MASAPIAWGAFCLANDVVAPRVVALFESLAIFAPGLPVWVIPFDERQDVLRPIVERFGHRYFEAPDLFDELDRIGSALYAESRFGGRGFRKLAAFLGPCERFFSLDSDVVALSPLSVIIEGLENSSHDLVYFDTDLDQVYREGPLRDRLRRGHDARGFNAGLFVSTRGLLDPTRLARSVEELPRAWWEALVPNAEQPFLNYFADTRGWRMRAAHELADDYCSTCWPAAGEIRFDGRSFRLQAPGRWDDGRKLFFAHWAGFGPDVPIPNAWLFEFFYWHGLLRDVVPPLRETIEP